MIRLSHARLAPRLRRPRRSARLRLTVLYGGLFLLSGVALLAATYLLFERATAYTKPQLPKIPEAPAIKQVGLVQLPSALHLLAQDQHQLAQDRHELKLSVPRLLPGPRQFTKPLPHLAQDQHQLAQDQHQLARGVNQLAAAVHQVTRAGSAQAAQRAADSHQLLLDAGIGLAIVAVLALLAGWLIAGRMLRPIRTITRTAQRISSTSLHERLALDGPQDELKELGDTLDELFARLEAAFEAQRHFVANASHELRTPLTRERALIQVALGDPSTSDMWRSTGQELLASNREQETLIDALLTLASSESGLDDREPVDLQVIARTVLCDRRDADRLGLHIDTTLASAPVDGDPQLLERLVANLVDNAIGHNVEGGHVHVSTGTEDGRGRLAVTNTGPVIRATEIDRLFRPFQRLDPHRIHNNGHGLGLSIVRAIATAHGATVTARPSPDGGVSIDVAFPRPAHPQHDVRATANALRAPTNRTERARPAPQARSAPPATPPERQPTVPRPSD